MAPRESKENRIVRNVQNRAIALKLFQFKPLNNKYLIPIIVLIIILIICISLIFVPQSFPDSSLSHHIANVFPDRSLLKYVSFIGCAISLVSIVYLYFRNKKHVLEVVNVRKKMVNDVVDRITSPEGSLEDKLMLKDLMSSGRSDEYKSDRAEEYEKLKKKYSDEPVNGAGQPEKIGGFNLSNYFDKDKEHHTLSGYYGYDKIEDTKDTTGSAKKLEEKEFKAISSYGEFEAISGYGEF